MVIKYITYLLIGLFSGFMSGMFGIGGGSVRIPLLNLAGLPLINAFGINLLVIPFSSLVGTISHKKNLKLKIGLYMVLGGAAGSISGALLVGIISPFALAIIFVAVSVLTILGIHLSKLAPNIYKKINPKPHIIILGAFILNFITGMRGGSGGSLFPPFLRTLKLKIHEAVATSLFVTTFTATAAIAIYWQRGDILWPPAIATLVGSIVGSRLGSVVSLKTKPKWLEVGLTLFVIGLAVTVLIKTIK